MRRLRLLQHLLAQPAAVPPKCLHVALRLTPRRWLPQRVRLKLDMMEAGAACGHFPRRHAGRGTMAPWLSANGLRAQCQHVLGPNQRRRPGPVRAGEAVFVQGDFLALFRREFLPGIREPFVLVTADTDAEAPGAHAALLEDPRVRAWFAANATQAHARLHAVPIGLRDDWRAHAALQAVLAEPAPARDVRLLGAFAAASHPERAPLRAQLATMDGAMFVPRVGAADYYRLLRRSRFVLSPRGVGLDCHRTWEALVCGAVPVVRASPLDPLFAGQPVLVVREWSELTAEGLDAAEAALRACRDRGAVQLATWAERIAAARAAAGG